LLEKAEVKIKEQEALIASLRKG
jgi:hypothetical protein